MRKTTGTERDRRSFLRKLMAGTAATLSLPAFDSLAETPAMPQGPGDPADEAYWEMVKRQFAVTDKFLMMNAANLCPAPYMITESVKTTLGDLSKDVSFQFRDKFEGIRAKSLEKLAAYLGVTTDEVGITRNTSESNNIIVNGFDFKAGDEVLLWDQNHPSNNIAWEQRAKRLGFTVKKISMPTAPRSSTELTQAFEKAITPKTKLIGFSHISNVSGIALPAKELCALARSKHIYTLVDGAQSFGMMDLNLKDMGCDFYSGSTHKWLMGPLENGILYVKKESAEKLWPLIISAGWSEKGTSIDDRFCILGQRNESTPAAIPETVEFHGMIGKQPIEERVRGLNTYLKEQLQSRIPQSTFVTPLARECSAGITVFNIPSKPSQEIFQKLYQSYGIGCASTMGVRVSPNIYNTKADIDRVVDAVKQIVA
ncbi:MAG: aminotransferase class V-fold PLP-dependent enzyme [Cyclobacteriaceae bacterium]|nr:aminotransferase class V-fold PLP-dependent enzyme [Cyclobacteriaceae bacterium]